MAVLYDNPDVSEVTATVMNKVSNTHCSDWLTGGTSTLAELSSMSEGVLGSDRLRWRPPLG